MPIKKRNLKINNEYLKKYSIWKQTPLSDFGSKCIMSEHSLCSDVKCHCICHYKKSMG